MYFKTTPHSKKALTLLEVILTIAVLSIGSLALVKGLYFSSKTTDDTRKTKAMFQLVRGYLEQMRVMSSAELFSTSIYLLSYDGSKIEFSKDIWNDVPENEFKDFASGARIQIKPMVTNTNNAMGKWNTITLDYRWQLTKSEVLPWIDGSLQSVVADLSITQSNPYTPSSSLVLATNQQPSNFPNSLSYGSRVPVYLYILPDPTSKPKPKEPDPLPPRDITPPPPVYYPPVYVPPTTGHVYTPYPPYVPPPPPPMNNGSYL